MIIEKFLNNNMLLVNDNHEEMIVMGKGLRFHYKVGDEIRDEDIEKIVSTFDAFEDVEKYATVVDVETIKENDCNLNISRYVDTTEEEEQVDIQKVLGEIVELEKKEAKTKEKLNEYLKELGFDVL